MRISTALVLAMFALGLGFSQFARADNTKYKITIPPSLLPIVSGKEVCKGQGVKVINNSGVMLHVIVKDGDGTVIIDEIIPDGAESVTPASFSKIGTPKIKIGAAAEQDLPASLADFCPFVPTLSEWAVVTMVFLLLVAGTIVFGRRPAVAG